MTEEKRRDGTATTGLAQGGTVAGQIEQRRAAWAWARVEEVAAWDKASKDREEYAGLALKLPALLQTSGLGQTMALLFAKGGGGKEGSGNRAYRTMYLQLQAWLRARMRWREDQEAMERIVACSPEAYRQATREVAAVSEWIKRFAKGRIE
ncbi:type III-B CRISPR module-associated protein Cmr5 [Myxococcota bacterium]|nr:type III-B CRISPR module-associated protein Cmr5 [Myxococcota bacterium]